MSESINRRSELIVKFLLRTGSATIEEILAVAGSSAPSIRRDLVRLESRGLIRRTHGGATLVEPLLYEPFRYDSSFLAREQRFAEQKRRIGLAAAELVQANETIGLTAGTTTTHVGRSLRHRDKIQVVTNAINIGMELCNQPGIRTYLTGGVVPWAWSFSLTGNAALDFLDDVYMDKMFSERDGAGYGTRRNHAGDRRSSGFSQDDEAIEAGDCDRGFEQAGQGEPGVHLPFQRDSHADYGHGCDTGRTGPV